MISVPEAGRFPSTVRPISRSNAPMRSEGKPSGYKGNGSSRRIPIISQCPVVVSLPADRSVARPCAEPGAAVASTPRIVVRSPSPSEARFGARIPPTTSAVFASVSEPSSPYATASGASPTPHESQTTTSTRGTSAAVIASPPVACSRCRARPTGAPRDARARSAARSARRSRRCRLHLRHGPLDVEEVRSQGAEDRDHLRALPGAMTSIGEARVRHELDVVGVRIGALRLDLAPQERLMPKQLLPEPG